MHSNATLQLNVSYPFVGGKGTANFDNVAHK